MKEPTLKEIRENHVRLDQIIDRAYLAIGETKIAHQDRAEVLKLLDEAKTIIETFQDDMESENGDRDETADEWLKKINPGQ